MGGLKTVAAYFSLPRGVEWGGNLDSRHIYTHGHRFFHSPLENFSECVYGNKDSHMVGAYFPLLGRE